MRRRIREHLHVRTARRRSGALVPRRRRGTELRRGAERLGLDQSALSRRIQKLEQTLGFRLMERNSHEVSLTQAGHQFRRDASSAMQGYALAVEEARRVAEGKSGQIRVAYMAFAATELMPASVAAFGRANPHVTVSLTYMRTQGQKLALANDEIDVGFLIGPFEHSDFESLLLSSELLYVVAPKRHPLMKSRALAPADLENVPIILGDVREWGEYRWRLTDLFNSEGVALNVRLEASTTLALIGLVAAGLGVTVYPESLIGFLGSSVDVRPIDNAAFRSRTCLVWKRNNRNKAVLDFVAATKARSTPASL